MASLSEKLTEEPLDLLSGRPGAGDGAGAVQFPGTTCTTARPTPPPPT